MTIQRIDHGHTRGFQVRVFRNGKLLTRFLSFAKHGGEDTARILAQKIEAELESQAGPISNARRLGGHASRPNRNSTSGVVGIRAYYSKRGDNTLHFVATWTDQNPDGTHIPRTAQFSAGLYGTLNALDKALRAREAGAGIKMMGARSAWLIIKSNMNKKQGKQILEADKK